VLFVARAAWRAGESASVSTMAVFSNAGDAASEGSRFHQCVSRFSITLLPQEATRRQPVAAP
jgi:hypothetical protein